VPAQAIVELVMLPREEVERRMNAETELVR
jgi:hypothetical protein